MSMNYANIKYYDIANGPGVRTSVFVSGCRHHCPGCFNAVAWDFDYGQPFDKTVRNEVFASCQPDYIAGLSLLGGEPFEPENQRELLPFVRNFKALYPAKTVWCYSGYTWEQLTGAEPSPARCEVTDELLALLDVLVDGRFVQAEHDISLRFRGSRNQRLLDTARHRVHRRAYGQVDHATRHGFGGGFEAGDTRPVVWRRICVEAHENPFLGRYVPKIRRTLGRDRPRVQSELCAVCSAYPQISLLVLRRQRGDLFRVFADWTIGGSAAQIADFSEEVDSGILVPSPLVRQIILIEDGLGGAHRFACTAVDALVGVDVQRAGTLVNAVDGALVHASLVLDIHARLSDYIWHGILLNKY